jgi:hypothetical protein
MNTKPLSDAVKKGLAYLGNQQHPGGGWGQGGGWRAAAQGGRVEGPNVEDPPDVANTCMATLALLRAGNSPRDGEYSDHVHSGLGFILGNVEAADAESPYVTDQRDTQVQVKIGPYVDTFLATLVLAEVKGQMPDEQGEARVSAALDKAVAKMERNQRADGSWADDGWAPVVGQSLGSAGLSRAHQKGAQVSDEALDRTEKYSRGHYDKARKSFSDVGTASVPLYGTASHLGSHRHALTSLQALKAKLRALAGGAATPQEKDRAAAQLKDIADAEVAHEEALGASLPNFRDPRFVQGFGSNGGEEFLSYMNISEALRARGGAEWQDWDKAVTENLERIQNQDGSWSGHHCITGRTFCTASALLVLMADRAPAAAPAPSAQEAAACPPTA